MGPPAKSILYCRLPGLLALSARSGHADGGALSPLAVVEGRFVRDASPLALARGVTVGMAVGQSRRLCPTLLAVPLEEVDARLLGRVF